MLEATTLCDGGSACLECGVCLRVVVLDGGHDLVRIRAGLALGLGLGLGLALGL